jgi:hypothetical protein
LELPSFPGIADVFEIPHEADGFHILVSDAGHLSVRLEEFNSFRLLKRKNTHESRQRLPIETPYHDFLGT